MNLSSLWSAYEADKRLEGYSSHTLKAYHLQLQLLVRHIGDVDVQTITYEMLKGYLVESTRHLKPASIGHRVRFLKSLFRYAHDEGLTQRNPAAQLKEPKQGHRIPKALSEDVIEELRVAATSYLEAALIEIFYATGCRIGEIVQLNRNSINFESRSIIVRGKGDKEREVYFTTRCAILLRRYLRSRRDTDIALFVTERAPRRMSIAQMRYIIKRIAKRAGIEVNVFPHSLRHSYATHLLNNGAPLEVIQSFLGHAKIDTTKLYAQLSGERRRELYRKYF
jgi:integrase/recombinase XerD